MKKRGRKPRAGVAANERVTVRLTPAEHAPIAAAAALAGVTVHEYMRAAALRAASETQWAASRGCQLGRISNQAVLRVRTR